MGKEVAESMVYCYAPSVKWEGGATLKLVGVNYCQEQWIRWSLTLAPYRIKAPKQEKCFLYVAEEKQPKGTRPLTWKN